MNRGARSRFSPPWVLTAVLLAGCSATPQRAPAPAPIPIPTPANDLQADRGVLIAQQALQLLGLPYKFGAAGPLAFDCSGLVHYVHQQLGIETPRTTGEQFQASRIIDPTELAAGDLLFFRIGEVVSHVAIYAGNGQFVHARRTGRPVEMRPLQDPYYASRLVRTGRLH